MDYPDNGRKDHENPVPYGGGIALIVTFIIVCVIAYISAYGIPEEIYPSEIKVHYKGFKEKIGDFYIIISAGILMGMIGFIDDIKPVKEIYKLLIELGLASLMWWLGFRITAHIPSASVSFIITVLWITGITNAFNFLDNMDGLSSGVALIVAILFAALGLQTGELFVGGYFVIIAGALLGFLLFNFPPASLFLGDCGSLFVGFLIALGAVVSTFYTPEASNKIFPLLAPILILAVPLFDSFSVIAIRIYKKKRLLKGDRSHFSHRLLRLGMKKRTVLMTIYLVTAGVGFSALYLAKLTTHECILATMQAVCVFSIIVLLERAGKQL